jgi:hypothetical protein
MRSLPCFMRLLPHAIAAAVNVEDGATTTATRYSSLHHHSNRCLRLRHTAVRWRAPYPLPLTG